MANPQMLLFELKAGRSKENVAWGSIRLEFLCAREVSIDTTYGWCYTSFSKCYRMLQRGFVFFTCASFNNDKAVGVLRYCVQLCVYDGTYTVGFAAFDGQMTNQRTFSRSRATYRPQFGGPDQRPLPQCLKDLVGSTFTFQLKFSLSLLLKASVLHHGMIPERTCLELKQLKTKSSTDFAKL
ncbi:hypothetical protein IGI04_025575 [Brassica rapa subsp. trilocularis]|uniref:Uncharacterized protein n=1 Tax=Brassica rapa subsp. trilocularis TaxID=1813537 RepID=A0ABQ7KTV6_BRACM|nr:hypothetical protein IGI04_025575 [Brassica rapa subsp. trilocularis]